jgi:transposase
MQITTIGLDIAKNVFQVHGIDAAEKVVVRKQLRRNQVLEFFKALPPCLIGMEACATAHYWVARAHEAWPQGSSNAGEGREGLRQAQQE